MLLAMDGSPSAKSAAGTTTQIAVAFHKAHACAMLDGRFAGF
jgi:hypothetical protein